MAEEKQSPNDEKKCTVCQITSADRILLHGIEQNRDIWVCVGCLPVLIHGAH